MTPALIIHRAGPGLSIQDLGRPGWLASGLSQSGATDRAALVEGAALLGQNPECAALEMAGMGGEFSATSDIRIALTGAPMRATADGAPLVWNASHLLAKGTRLVIGAPLSGIYGYLHVGGGFDTPYMLGARAAHLGVGLGAPLVPGDHLALLPDPKPASTGWILPEDNRFDGGTIRVVPGPQTEMFAPAEIARFETTPFQRDLRSNRMGARLNFDADGFHSCAGLSVISEIIRPGDIQITGDGTPFVLLYECQTTGGYPRIGSVLPCDIARVAQAQPGRDLKFRFLTLEQGVEAEMKSRLALQERTAKRRPLLRNPHDMHDLLSYQLVSGATAGDDLERESP